MAARRGPHIKDIFVQNSTPASNFVTSAYPSNGFQLEKKSDDSKQKYKSSKKTAAPPRPSFGDYKPKILQVDSIVNIPIAENKSPSTAPKKPPEALVAKPLVIGDKDVPIVIQPIEAEDDHLYMEIPEENSFRNSQSNSHEEDHTTTNPLFVNSEKSAEGHRQSASNKQNHLKDQSISEQINGVTIPDPDYEEDEAVMEFDGEGEMDVNDSSKSRPKSVYKDFHGEDFSHYLADEVDDESTFSRHVKHNRLGNKIEGKRYKKRDSAHTMFGGTVKNGKCKSGSVRYYSVEDTKLGLGVDGKAKAHTIRNGVNYGSSYESFLNSRHGTTSGPGDAANREIGENVKYPKNEKDTVWKKLTLRLKRKIVMMH